MVLASFWFEVVSQNVCRILREEEERIREIDIDDQFGLNALSLFLLLVLFLNGNPKNEWSVEDLLKDPSRMERVSNALGLTW